MRPSFSSIPAGRKLHQPCGRYFRRISSRPAFTSVAQKVYYPTYEEWSLAVEREIAKNLVASITYVGNHGYHEPVANFPNQYDAAGTNASLPGALTKQVVCVGDGLLQRRELQLQRRGGEPCKPQQVDHPAV